MSNTSVIEYVGNVFAIFLNLVIKGLYLFQLILLHHAASCKFWFLINSSFGFLELIFSHKYCWPKCKIGDCIVILCLLVQLPPGMPSSPASLHGFMFLASFLIQLLITWILWGCRWWFKYYHLGLCYSSKLRSGVVYLTWVSPWCWWHGRSESKHWTTLSASSRK